MAREYTNKLLEMIENGLLTNEQVLNACINYMSEEEVKGMMEMNEFIIEEEEEMMRTKLISGATLFQKHKERRIMKNQKSGATILNSFPSGITIIPNGIGLDGNLVKVMTKEEKENQENITRQKIETLFQKQGRK